jgi:hypothetical protein
MVCFVRHNLPLLLGNQIMEHNCLQLYPGPSLTPAEASSL